MARINVEDSIWLDPRFKAFSKKLGCDATAIGYLVIFWRLSQEQFRKNKLITELQFKLSGLPELLFEYDLAERIENGIRAKGDQENHSWLIERQKAGKSKSPKKAQAAQNRENNKRDDLASHETNQTLNHNKAQQSTTSSSYSSSKREETTYGTSAIAADAVFEEIFTNYPKRNNSKKSVAKKKGLHKRLSSLEVDLLKTAVLNYSNYVRQKQLDERYIKQIPTFLSEWKDWINPEKYQEGSQVVCKVSGIESLVLEDNV